MAERYHTEIRWEKAPGARDLARLNELLKRLDWDAPDLTEAGMLDDWRSPLFRLSVVLAILHMYGHPCRGRQMLHPGWHDGKDEPVGWTDEPLEMSRGYIDMDYGTRRIGLVIDLLAFSRRFAKWLPGEGRMPTTPRRKRSEKAQRA